MKARVNQDECVSCALCVDKCPSVFAFNSDNKSEALTEHIPGEREEDVRIAAYECPTGAIMLS